MAWLCLASLLLASATPAPADNPPVAAMPPTAEPGPITPIPEPPVADPLKLALGEQLFADHRLSHDGTLACSSCHDLHTNGADRVKDPLNKVCSTRSRIDH